MTPLLLQLLLLTGSILLLWFGAEWVVDSAAAVARRFNVPELVIGLTIVAFGTSAPEFFVTVTAALKGMPSISLSNIVGSNIINLGLVLGVSAMIRPVIAGMAVLYRDGVLGLFLACVALLFLLTGGLGRLIGAFLLLVLGGYLYRLLKVSRCLGDFVDTTQRTATWKDYPKLAAGFVAVSLGGQLLVDSASFLARAMGVSEWFIGMTIVAAGTSLPEMVTCLLATARGKNDMLIGNVLGSNVFNIAGVLGLTCLVHPLASTGDAVTGMMVLVGITVATCAAMRTDWRISRTEGAFLVLAVMGYWLWDLAG